MERFVDDAYLGSEQRAATGHLTTYLTTMETDVDSRARPLVTVSRLVI